MTVEITEDDIAYAEKLLLPAGQSFDDERRAFIRCMESRDVIACPGSGKTTALLAKILILAKKMPFEDDRGICVLTHTNVAIDEITQQADHMLLIRYSDTRTFSGRYKVSWTNFWQCRVIDLNSKTNCCNR